MLSAVVLTKNDEKNIKECLESLSFCDEIIIIDDNSTDNTLKIAQKENKKLYIYKRILDNNFSDQRNFGLLNARGEWILFLDADERVSFKLADEITAIISGKSRFSFNGFYIKRKDKFLGKWLKHGETSQTKLLRLARKNSGRWQGMVHEVWRVEGEIGQCKNHLLHERQITIIDFLNRLNFYSTLKAEDLYCQGVKTNIYIITLYPLMKFIQNYIFRIGFLDGTRGLIFAMMMSLHSFMVRSKLWIMQKNKGKEEFKIDNWP